MEKLENKMEENSVLTELILVIDYFRNFYKSIPMFIKESKIRRFLIY
jgi:hypothetical protein